MLFRQQHHHLTVFAPAKVNLFLKILGKRTDGFHELESVMVSLGLYDTLEFCDDPTGKLTLQCRDTAGGLANAPTPRTPLVLSSGPDNLVLRAAVLLREYATVGRGAAITLAKRIPLAAGLAGGSSDAAATLVGLNRLWGLGLSLGELHSLAAKLGSDVNFFLSPTGAAICRGRGEQIQPVQLPRPLHLVVVKPPSGLSTALVFRHCQPAQVSLSAEEFLDALQEGRHPLGDRWHNTLQAPAMELNPDIRRVARAFSRQPVLGHLMSGSGTSYFGVCAHRRQAMSVAGRLRAERLGEVFVVGSRV